MRHMLFAATFLFIAASTTLAQSTDRSQLDGWGPFRFSMSIREAKAAVGSDAVETSLGTLLYDTRIAELNFRAAIVFEGAARDRISEISVGLQGVDRLDAERCVTAFRRVAALVAERWGDPATPEQEVPWATPAFRRVQVEYLFQDGARVRPSAVVRRGPDSLMGFDCAVGVTYTPGPRRARTGF